jgi:hypothetical protein
MASVAAEMEQTVAALRAARDALAQDHAVAKEV